MQRSSWDNWHPHIPINLIDWCLGFQLTSTFHKLDFIQYFNEIIQELPSQMIDELMNILIIFSVVDDFGVSVTL